MKEFGIWILLSFGFYYILALMTGSKNVLGALLLGSVLALGVVLVFF